MSSWNEMKEAGWEFLRTDEKNRKVFKTPVRKGKRRTISQKRDLDEQDLKYAKILFPGKNEVDLILQEEMALQVGQEGEVQEQLEEGKEQEGDQERGAGGEEAEEEEEVDVGQEAQLDVGQEGEVNVGQEGEVNMGRRTRLVTCQECRCSWSWAPSWTMGWP